MIDLPDKSLINDMIQWRHDIHRHPELAFQEKRTSTLVKTLLESFGCEIHYGLAKTGVLGSLRCGDGKKHIALRADMDALPIIEENTFAHRSIHPGVMHACGHDGHTAMLLGAAKYLCKTRNFDGTLHFIFQPAEEGVGGAKVMIEEGLFDHIDVDEIYGLHNWPGIEVGQFAIRAGAMMASSDKFDITITGKGTHSGIPHNGVNPILVGQQVIGALQSMYIQQDAVKNVILSFTQFEGGSGAYNIVPEKVRIKGSLRAHDQGSIDYFIDAIHGACRHIGQLTGASCLAQFNNGYPVLINSQQETANAVAAACQLVGRENVNTDVSPIMGAEDFAFMLREKPGAYILLGNGPDGSQGGCTVHNPNYDFNDQALAYGAGYWISLVETLLPTTRHHQE